MDGNEEVWIVSLASGALGIVMVVIGCLVCCYKRCKSKPIEHEEEEDTCDQKLPQFGTLTMLKKRASDQFTIPLLRLDKQRLPFTIQEVHVTENASVPDKKPDVINSRPRKKRSKREKKVSVYMDPGHLGQQTLSRRFETLSNSTDNYPKTGVIHFCTEYITEELILQVLVYSVTDITVNDETTQIYPFVRLSLSSGKKQKKDTTVQDTRNPTFNEMIEFRGIERDMLTRQKLKIKVYSQVTIRQKELLGQVDILMSSLSLYGKEMFDVALFKQKSTITMTSVLITLCHQATFTRLEVFIEKLKGVPRGSRGSSIYGALTLRKGHTSVNRNTTLKHHNNDPIFEEMLTFENLSTSSAVPLRSYSLVFSLVERSMMGNDHILGMVVFSLNSPQSSAIKQWEALQSQPHTNHTCWHYLVGPDEL